MLGSYHLTASFPGKPKSTYNKTFTVWDTPKNLTQYLSGTLPDSKSIFSEVKMCSDELSSRQSSDDSLIGLAPDMNRSLNLMNDTSAHGQPAVLIGDFEIARRRRIYRGGGSHNSIQSGEQTPSTPPTLALPLGDPDNSSPKPSPTPDNSSQPSITADREFCSTNSTTFKSSNTALKSFLKITPKLAETRSSKMIWKTFKGDKETILAEIPLTIDKGSSYLEHTFRIENGWPIGNYELVILPETKTEPPISRRFTVK